MTDKITTFVRCPACGEPEVPVIFNAREHLGCYSTIKAVCPFCRRDMVVEVSVQITANVESVEDYSPARDE